MLKTFSNLENKDNAIWVSLYAPFFHKIANSDYMDTYCKYITQQGNEDSKKWIEVNPEKLTEFGKWLQSI